MTDTKRNEAIGKGLILIHNRIVEHQYTFQQLIEIDKIMLGMFHQRRQGDYVGYVETRFMLANILADIIELTHQKTPRDEKTLYAMENILTAIGAIKNTPLPQGTFLSPVAGSC